MPLSRFRKMVHRNESGILCRQHPVELLKDLKTCLIPFRKMVKDNETVIEYLILDLDHVPTLNDSREFNKLVNMTA